MPAPKRRPARRVPATIGPWVRRRIIIAAAGLSLLLGAIGYKAYALQVDQRERFRQLARRQHVKTVEIPAPRGVIHDAAGRELAVTADASSVFASPREVVDVVGTAERLAQILDLDVRELESRLASQRHFAWIERHVTVEEAEAIRAADLPGIDITEEPRRFYPGRALAGPVLGFAGIDGNGLDGLELELEPLLAGQRASLEALRDATGGVMLAEGLVEPRPGASVTLTLDRAIQHIAERALEEAVAVNKPTAASIVVLDVHTGGVLAMANYPSYDPNAPAAGLRARARNRTITDAFEIGSAMKVFTVAAALDAGAVRPDQTFDIENGRYKIGRKVIRDTYRDEVLDVGGIIKRSSNVGSAKIAQRLGAEALHDALVRFGFGDRTGIELPGERAGLVHPAERWREIDLITTSFGYHMNVTMLQLAAGYAAIGNGGVYNEPRIVTRVEGAEGEILYRHQPRGRRIMKAETARALLPMLASVFDKGKDGGTARSIDVAGYRAGGKTGTAHKLDPNGKGYADDLYLSSFAGLAPIDAPRIAVVVLVDEPRGEEHYGSLVAGPAFASVVSGTLRYLGVPEERLPAPEEAPEPEPAPADPVQPIVTEDDGAEPAPEPGGIALPSFEGMSIPGVIEASRAACTEVRIVGSGRAVDQDPPPGRIERPTMCRVTFDTGDR